MKRTAHESLSDESLSPQSHRRSHARQRKQNSRQRVQEQSTPEDQAIARQLHAVQEAARTANLDQDEQQALRQQKTASEAARVANLDPDEQ